VTGEVWLILGGARSGKTRRGLAVAASRSCRTYIATAETRDDEMRARIARHRTERDAGWKTVEAPLDLCGALRDADDPGAAIVVDCLTLWLSNLIERERSMEAETNMLTETLAALSATVILISNEVGSGIVPANALSRRFRDAQGWLNQAVAAAADHVELMVAGLPLKLK
jgi:adenosylcobinamide kinase / adenosylcobinamide-phosphate guanylyltransferase